MRDQAIMSGCSGPWQSRIPAGHGWLGQDRGVSGVKSLSGGSYARDPVALSRNGQLPEDGAAGPVQGRDQVRTSLVCPATPARGPGIHRNHPQSGDYRCPGPGPCPHDPGEGVGVHPGQHPPKGRLIRCPTRRPATLGLLDLRSDALPDRRDRAGTGQHRTDSGREHAAQRVAHPTPGARVGHQAQHVEQTSQTRGVQGSGSAWSRR